MMIIGLLMIALVCLVLGLALHSSVWLVASLIGTAGAAFVIWKGRTVIPRPAAADEDADEPTTNVLGEPVGGAVDPTHAPEAAGRSAATMASDDTTVITAVDDTSEPADHPQVWVIDGRPRYHLADCAIIQGQDAEPIPIEQATEDGFMPCSLCEPNLAHSAHSGQ